MYKYSFAACNDQPLIIYVHFFMMSSDVELIKDDGFTGFCGMFD